jgi:Holliday junction DNA helicase RuvB
MVLRLGRENRQARGASETAAATDTAKRPPIGRPQTIEEMVGQEAVIGRLRIVIEGAKARGTRVPHVLLTGSSGMGKTTLAHIIANELGGPLLATAGPLLRKGADLSGLLSSVRAETVLFIDEIHRLPHEVSESLYQALEEGCLSVLRGYGADARAITINLPALTVVGATNMPGLLTTALRDRFGFQASLEPYSIEELGTIVRRAFVRMGMAEIEEGPCRVIAERCKGVPRIALHLADRTADVAALEDERVDVRLAMRALAAFDIDRFGLDSEDYRLLGALVVTFSGRPVGLNAWAQVCDMDEWTVRDREAALIRAGFLVRTPKGRMALPRAHQLVEAH